jgi:hypothetical protein
MQSGKRQGNQRLSKKEQREWTGIEENQGIGEADSSESCSASVRSLPPLFPFPAPPFSAHPTTDSDQGST